MRNLKKPGFTAIAYHKHGKTEFYRDFLRQLEPSEDQFEKAEGAPGMVIVVFTLPSYERLFHFRLPLSSRDRWSDRGEGSLAQHLGRIRGRRDLKDLK
jgi:isocitrate dehydrogenase kinase/phosphatase